MAESDELYTVKNNYWLGNFQDAIDEAKTLRLRGETARQDRDVLIYRSYIGLKNYKLVLSEIPEGTAAPAALQAVRLFAQYMAAAGDKRTKAASAVSDLMADPVAAVDPTAVTIAGTVAISEGNFAGALKAVRGSSNLEHLALACNALLRMDRPELAENVVTQMKSIDDESALTSLSAGILYLTMGDTKIKEAASVYKELLDRFGRSSAGLNGLATAYIAQKRFEDAERTLGDALENNPDDADTLVNVITLQVQSGQLGKKFQENVAKLRTIAPTHPYVEALSRAEDMFERVAANYGV